MIYSIRHLIGSRDVVTVPFALDGVVNIHAPWVRAVPLPFAPGFFARCIAAWAVLTGAAHAIYWPKPGDLEEALDR